MLAAFGGHEAKLERVLGLVGNDAAKLDRLLALVGNDGAKLERLLGMLGDDAARFEALLGKLGNDAGRLERLLAVVDGDAAKLEALLGKFGNDGGRLEHALKAVENNVAKLEELLAKTAGSSERLEKLLGAVGNDVPKLEALLARVKTAEQLEFLLDEIPNVADLERLLDEAGRGYGASEAGYMLERVLKKMPAGNKSVAAIEQALADEQKFLNKVLRGEQSHPQPPGTAPAGAAREIRGTHSPEIWPQRSVKWQSQLAQAVFDSSAPRMIPLLRAMLRASDLDVAIAAVESLEGRDDIFWPDDDDRAALHALLARANSGDQTIIQTLLKRGSAPPG